MPFMWPIQLGIMLIQVEIDFFDDVGFHLQELCKTFENITFGILPFIKGSFSASTSSIT
jgi:hypothetical protein